MSWKSIVGHERVARLLKGQLRQDRAGSTYLFVGPGGIGKRLLATAFAKAASCAQAAAAEPCENCESCQKISALTWPDFKVVDQKSAVGRMGIDEIRDVSHWIAMTPSQGRFRIALVDGVDQMTPEASHACLKLLEEPPQKGLILLIAQALHRLPSTLISRCHLVRCVPQGAQRVISYLQEKEGVTPEKGLLLASLSGGRLGLAMELHRKNLSDLKNATLTQLLTARRQKAVEVPLSASTRPELEQVLEWLAAWWRDLVILKLGGESGWVFHQDRMKELQAAASQGPGVDELLSRLDRTYQVKEAIQQNVSPRIALAALLTA